MILPSKLIEDAVNAFATLPGIGKKTALRLTLHLLQAEPEKTEVMAQSILNMRRNTNFCSECNNIADGTVCSVCSSRVRNRETVCVVESLRDLLAIENTQQYNGLYHILGGVISPIDGIGPGELYIDQLMRRVQQGEIKEIIMALSPTIEGDTTIYYLSKQLKPYQVKISTIARGVAFGGDLEYADEITLGRSITSRITYEQ